MAAATAAVLSGVPAHGRAQLIQALQREHEHSAHDLELGRRSALRFGQQRQPPPPPQQQAAAAASPAATRAAGAAEGSADVAGAAAAPVGAAAAAAALGAAHDAPRAPTTGQLARVAFSKGVPFIFFGFFDNALMITGGGALEQMIGARFGLSVLACSGLANTFADVFGLHISHVVEDKYKRSGWAMLKSLTPEQADLPSVRRAKMLGAAAGVATGCLLGLTPLAFMNQPAIAAHGAAAAAAGAAAGAGGG